MASFPSDDNARQLRVLTVSALGVVFGDIGTSPLYALAECFSGAHGVAPTPGNVLGVLSLIFWSLLIVISIKYVLYVMRANNQGEGGILALFALIPPRQRGPQGRGLLAALALFGAALLYGDGIITPAISVLGAVEGLSALTPALTPYVVPTTIAILVALFVVQYGGTARVGAIFGPVMLVWFAVIGIIGAVWIVRHPVVLSAVVPTHAIRFFTENGVHGFVVLGAVFLVVTGGEALYADMGHFGVRPIRLAWFSLVLPALLLNYFGQGALLLADPSAAQQPFYRTVPTSLVVPLVVLATLAACIASQALISAVFSLTRQAVQLGYSPRLEIRHTSATTMGQIYMPVVNWALLAGTVALVWSFGSVSALAGAYGIAVTATMAITTLLAAAVARRMWGWRPGLAAVVTVLFLIIDLAFLGANALKILSGGWVPLALAAAVFTAMTTWKRGREILGIRLRERAESLEGFLADLARTRHERVPGTAVYMTGSGTGVPPTLSHNVRHNKALHAQIVLLTVETAERPVVSDAERIRIEVLRAGFFRVALTYGFMEEPDVPAALSQARGRGLPIDKDDVAFFLGRETLLVTSEPGMARWREWLFALMSRNALRATAFFRIPPDRVVELGIQVRL